MRTLLLVTSLLLLGFSENQTVEAADIAAPHIVFVLADDMGYGDPGCYNSASKIPTPHIDRLAREGLRFTDAHAPGSVCVPSRYGLLSGRYPFRNRMKWNLPGANLQPNRYTLASLLKKNGYHTVCVGKWHLGFDCDHPTQAGQKMPGGPVDVGFDYFFGMWASLDIPPYYYIENDRCVLPPSKQVEENHSEGVRPIQGAFWRGGGIAPGLRHEDVLPTFVAKAVGQIENHAREMSEKPLFLYLPLPAPHTPWVPDAKHHGRSKAGDYGDYTAEVDSALGSVIKALQKQNMLDNTLLVFSSDNGPVWFDEDVARYDHRCVGPLRGMKGDIWEGGHRVPFVVRWPGHVNPGTTSDALICFTDMLATFAALLGDELPRDQPFDSVNILPVLNGDKNATGRQTLLHSGGVVAVRQGPWKLIPGLGSFGFSPPKRKKPQPGGPQGQLYNLADDPGETKNLWLEHPKVVARLSQALTEKESPKLPPKEKFHLYLLIGQSNMAGRGNMTEQDRLPVPRVLKLDKRNLWVPANQPLHFDKPAIAGVGLGMTFAQEMAKQDPSITVGLIPCAVGGTPLRRWVQGGDLYNAALKRAKWAMQHGTLQGVLWHQGEGDCGSQQTAETYAARLDGMVADLRADLQAESGNATLPLVVGGLCPAFLDRAKSSFANTVETALAELPRRVKHTGFASAEGLKSKPDKTHFNADSLREFGRRYAAVMQDLVRKAEGAKPQAAAAH